MNKPSGQINPIELAQVLNALCETELRRRMTTNGVLHPYAKSVLENVERRQGLAKLATQPWSLQARFDGWIRTLQNAKLEIEFLREFCNQYPGWLVHPTDFDAFCCSFISNPPPGLDQFDHTPAIEAICFVTDKLERDQQWSLGYWFKEFCYRYRGPGRRAFVAVFESRFMAVERVLEGRTFALLKHFLYPRFPE